MKFKKYKSAIFLNINSYINLGMEKINKNKQKIVINYSFSKRIKIIKNFIFLYSIIFILQPFSNLYFQSNVEFKLKFNIYFFLMIDTDYSNFYF